MKKPHPRMIEVDLTNRCNLNCSFCISREVVNHKPTDMKRETLEDIIYEASQYTHGCGIVFTGGGEPCLHPRFREFVDLVVYAVRNDLIPAFSLVSNGTDQVIDNCRYFLSKTSEPKSWFRLSLNDRKLTPKMEELIREFPERVGISLVHQTPEQENECIFNEMEIKNKNLPVKPGAIRERKAIDKEIECSKTTPDNCQGKFFHKIYRADGKVPYCCIWREIVDGKPPRCPEGCRWSLPTFNLSDFLKYNPFT